MGSLRAHLLLALSVTLGSALPFVPTGEMVSGAAAVASHSKLNVVLIFLITWLCSVLGDSMMLVEARLGARKLRPWVSRRKFAAKVEQAERSLAKNSFNAIVTGRLIPGGRTPVIVALGLARLPLGRFVAADVVACALWAAIYSTLGSIGGRIAHHPVWAMVVAIAFATSIGVLVQKIASVMAARRDRMVTVEGDAPGQTSGAAAVAAAPEGRAE